jgi:hypothetical protein
MTRQKFWQKNGKDKAEISVHPPDVDGGAERIRFQEKNGHTAFAITGMLMSVAWLAGLPDEILVCPDGQTRAREVGLPGHEHIFDAARAAVATVRGHAGPGDVRDAGRLLAAADRDDLGIVGGSRGVEELLRVALDDTSPIERRSMCTTAVGLRR